MRPPARRSSALPALLLAIAPLAACASSSREVESIDETIRLAHYEDAVREAARVREEHPDDPATERAWKRASAALLLKQARTLSFDGRSEEALDKLLEADSMLPGDKAIGAWLGKVRSELADQCIARAADQSASSALDDALASYERALSYEPWNSRAREGAARVLLKMNYRAGLGETYYRDGVRALREFWLANARALFDYTAKYMPKDERVGDRKREVRQLLAEDRVSIARQFEGEKLFWAARNEYRLALLLDPDRTDASEGRDRMARECVAAERFSEAERLARRHEYDKAFEVLAQGQAMTEHAFGEFEALRGEIEEARLTHMYEAAFDLERDFRFEDAGRAYARVLEQAAGTYGDALERQQLMEGYVVEAAELYARALAAGSDAERLGLFRQIEVFWPEYEDIRDRMAVLEAALARAAAPGGSR